MEFIRKPAQACLEIELERLAGLEPHELSSSRSLGRGGERRHGATAVAALQPHIDVTAVLLDQIGRWIRDDDSHQREMIADASPLRLVPASSRPASKSVCAPVSPLWGASATSGPLTEFGPKGG